MGLYKIEGVVLRRRNLGEADRLVTVLSRDRGKLTLVARGARRPRSRLGGRLEPCTRFRALVVEGRSLDLVSQVEVLDARATLRDDLERMAAATILLELTDRALADRQPHPDVYQLLEAALDLIGRGGAHLAWMWYAARLLGATGHRPSIVRCVACGQRSSGAVAWSVPLGGALHERCRARDPRAVALPGGAMALLAFLLDASPAAVRRLTPPVRDLTAAGEALLAYAEARWEARLRAPAVAARLAGGALAVVRAAQD
ncbi:MAG: DNA repair protein RecO [Armatimonadota bacterium]|nr:DNA repair protein RecO [Armatimonadota bacterium]MDR7420851.1 DNA repair protein RecO [Armatimonadota bacterium]MDR7453698.1 DNA repair protein RecO [Armatimonadota bacterium]MDR7457684.1 DNA repair protein RecO [Armatimonadota bacterium]MDR7495583.1 DNA repair protein RecO [Armatimonadota bacterium]